MESMETSSEDSSFHRDGFYIIDDQKIELVTHTQATYLRS
jgi:hypothetical protein